MAKKKNLKSNLHRLLQKQTRLGTGKRMQKKSGVNIQAFIYSKRTADKMHRLATTFGNFMRQNHPQVRHLSQIRPEHITEYYRDRGAQWSQSTCQEYESQFRKLAVMANAAYPDCHLDLSEVHFKREMPDPGQDSGRGRAMSEEDYQALDSAMFHSQSRARFIPRIARSIGARLEEACSIKAEHIVLKSPRGPYVALRNCKNGRNRDVPIRDRDLPFWQKLKTFLERSGWPNACGGIACSSVSKAIRRALKKLGLSEKYSKTGIHAIRKLYARERYREELLKGEESRKAWSAVQQELGHGPGYRTKLFRVYIGTCA